MRKLLSYCLVLMYAFQLCFASGVVAQAADESPVLINEKFDYEDGTAATAIDGFTFSGSGSAVVDKEEDGNKALLLSASSTASSTVKVDFGPTTSTKFKVSFKMKWVKHARTTVQNWFGSVRSGGTALLRTRHMYGDRLVAYSGTSNQSFVSCSSSETSYKKVTYILDTEAQSSQIFVDGVQIGSTWSFSASGTSADNLIFDLMSGSSVYLDDIYVENLVPLKKVDERFNYDAGTKASDINGFAFSGSGSAVVAEEADGNKSLLVSSTSNSDTLTLSFADTTSNKVKVSFKAKWVVHNDSVAGTYLFGAVRNGSTELLKTRDYGGGILGYFGASSNVWLNNAISTEDYVEISYILDINGGYSDIYINGTQAGNYMGTKWFFVNTATSVNNLYFQLKSGSELYLDDFKVENVKLAVEDITPDDKTEDVDINSSIAVKFNDLIAAEHLTSEYFALECNGKAVDAGAYTISESNGLVTIAPTKSWSYNSNYTVTVSKAVNTECTGYITLDEDYSFDFKTADFKNVTEYVYDFENYNENDVPSLMDGLGWSITAPTGSSARVAVDEKTKVLQLNSLDSNKLVAKLTFPYIDGDIIDISYDFKAPNHSANANDLGFGSVMNGNTLVTKGWMYSGSLIYWGI